MSKRMCTSISIEENYINHLYITANLNKTSVPYLKFNEYTYGQYFAFYFRIKIL